MSPHEKLETCIDCDAEEGARHRRGCTQERCPFCFDRLASCACEAERGAPAIEAARLPFTPPRPKPWAGAGPSPAEALLERLQAARIPGGADPAGDDPEVAVWEVPDLGQFEVTRYSPYEGRNPRTGQRIDVPAKSVLRFRVASALAEALQGEGPALSAIGGAEPLERALQEVRDAILASAGVGDFELPEVGIFTRSFKVLPEGGRRWVLSLRPFDAFQARVTAAFG